MTQVRASIATARAHLEAHPGDGPARYVEALLTRFEVPDIALTDADKQRVASLLSGIWRGLLESHYTGRELLAFALALVDTVHDAPRLAELAHHAGAFHGSWHSAATVEVLGAERLARAALAIDPDNDSALWLYSCDDFLARYNRARPKGAPKLRGAPVPARDVQAWVTRIEDTMGQFDRGEHPSRLYMKMDVVPVDAPAVVTALIEGLDKTTEWRGRMSCAQALGRAVVDTDRVCDALGAALRAPLPPGTWYDGDGERGAGEQHVASRAAESIGALGDTGLPALPALLDAIEAAPAFDVWDQRTFAEALLALAPRATGALRRRAFVTLERLVEKTRALPREQLAFYGRSDFLAAARQVGVGAPHAA